MTKIYKQEKIDAIDVIKDSSGKSKIMIFTDHQGLTVAQMTKLRDKLYEVNGKYTVVKNTLAVRAIETQSKDRVKEVFNGSSSVVYGYGDVVAPAKIVAAFIKENQKPAIKGAIMDGLFMEPDDVKKLSLLPTKEVLLAKAFAGMKSPIVSFVNVLQGPIRKLVYALNEIKQKKGV
jgi:large subunit ribosomal protein L10